MRQNLKESNVNELAGMEIGYVVRDASRWEADTERDASEFDSGYYRKLLKRAWDEVAFVFKIVK